MVARMILCHCAAVTDRTIASLIDEGATSVAEIIRRCGAGRCCASCREEIAAMLPSPRPAADRAGRGAVDAGTAAGAP